MVRKENQVTGPEGLTYKQQEIHKEKTEQEVFKWNIKYKFPRTEGTPISDEKDLLSIKFNGSHTKDSSVQNSTALGKRGKIKASEQKNMSHAQTTKHKGFELLSSNHGS